MNTEMDEKGDILPVYGRKYPITEGQLDRLVDFMEKQKLITATRRHSHSSRHSDSGPTISDMWETVVAELNEMPGGARKQMQSWKKTKTDLINSVRHRLMKLTSCDQAVANLLRSSFNDRDRRIMKYCALKNNLERRVSKEQDAVIVHYLQKYPKMLPTTDDGQSLMTPLEPHETALWLALTGVLNALGSHRTPQEWRKYIDNALEAVHLTGFDPASHLERGIARIVWPGRFEGCGEEALAANIGVLDAYTSRARRDFMLQFDVLAHYLELYPRMWTRSDSNAPEWIEMTDLMNIVGPARSPNEWLQLVQTSIRNVHNNQRYLMNWFDRLLSDRYAQTHPSDATIIIRPKSNDKMTCGVVYRTDSGHLQFECPLCGRMCVNAALFQQHIADQHGIETDTPTMGKVPPFVDDKQMVHGLDSDDEEESDEESFEDKKIPFESVHTEHEDEDRKPVASIFIKSEPNVDDEEMIDDAPMLASVFIKEEPAVSEVDESTSPETFATPSNEKSTFECDYCKGCFALKGQLRYHMNVHRNKGFSDEVMLKCPSCDFRCVSKEAMSRHKKRLHPTSKYACAECDEIFARNSYRNEHFKTAHMQPIDTDVASNWTLVEAAGEHHSCPNCEQTFNSSREFQAHRSLQHPNDVYRFNSETGTVLENMRSVTGGRHYRCNICQMVTKSVSDMNKHLVRHSNVKPVMCSRCEFTCIQRSELTAHRREKHNDGVQQGSNSSSEMDKLPFVCDVCGYRCRFKYYIQRHRRSHTGERPFQCLEVGCEGVAFRDKKGLRRHFMSKHYVGPDAFKCRACDERFAKEHTLKAHMKKHHPELQLIVAMQRR